MRFCYKYIGPKEDVEEIVSDVFISLWENRENIRSLETLKPFLIVTARNKILNYIRKKVNSPSYEEYIEYRHASLLSHSPDNLEYKEFEMSLLKLIAKLSPTQKKVIMMSKFENLSNTEISTILGLNIQTVKNALSEGLKTLRAMLGTLKTIILSFIILNS